MIVPVCIIVVFCNPFRNICTELNWWGGGGQKLYYGDIIQKSKGSKKFSGVQKIQGGQKNQTGGKNAQDFFLQKWSKSIGNLKKAKKEFTSDFFATPPPPP